MGWFLKSRRQTQERNKVLHNKVESKKSDYRAVKIKPARTACATALEIAKYTYLCKDAPLLPLNHCDCLNNCKCRYEHLADRRQDYRRAADNGLPARYIDGDRRAMMDRRQVESYF